MARCTVCNVPFAQNPNTEHKEYCQHAPDWQVTSDLQLLHAMAHVGDIQEQLIEAQKNLIAILDRRETT